MSKMTLSNAEKEKNCTVIILAATFYRKTLILVRKKIRKVNKYRHFARKGFETLLRDSFRMLNPKTNVGKLRNDILMTEFTYFQNGHQKSWNLTHF